LTISLDLYADSTCATLNSYRPCSGRNGAGKLCSECYPRRISLVEDYAGPELLVPAPELGTYILKARRGVPAGRLNFAPVARERHGHGYRVPDEIRHLGFGQKVPPAGFKGFATSSAPPTTNASATPPNVSLIGLLTPIRDQKYRGTCVAFAVGALAEAGILRDTGQTVDLSEQYIYFQARQNDPDRDQDGTFIHYALDGLQSLGACPESIWPYEPYNDWGQALSFSKPAFSLGAMNRQAKPYKIRGYRALAARDVAAIKTEIAAGRPVAVGVTTFRAAWDGNGFVEATGEVQLPLTRTASDGSVELLDEVSGGHAIALVGYVDTPDPAEVEFRPGGGYFIFKNSWGMGWAAQSPISPGFGILPYEYLERYNQDAYVLS
jgi:C1A family cysteine protease